MFLLVQAAQLVTICYSSHGTATSEINDYSVPKHLKVQASVHEEQKIPRGPGPAALGV